jgi:hypothetical protein
MTIAGGLGNQLFQYAAGYAIAKDNNRELKLDLSFYGIHKPHGDTTRQIILTKYNIPAIKEEIVELSVTPVTEQKIRTINHIKTLVKKSAFLIGAVRAVKKLISKKVIPTIYIEPDYHYDNEFILSGMTEKLIGQFQSENYFKKYEQDIRGFFTLKDPLSKIGQHNLDKIEQEKTPVSLHVRRGDFVQSKSNQNLYGAVSIDYYNRAIELMIKLYGDDVHFFIFSDDPAYVTEMFSFLKNKTVVMGDTDFPQEDLHLMSQCQHNIIANSTFSWWGAWLNSAKDKTVFAPRWWFSRDTMKSKNIMDVYPEGWIVL